MVSLGNVFFLQKKTKKQKQKQKQKKLVEYFCSLYFR
jgi:hypothetical protein